MTKVEVIGIKRKANHQKGPTNKRHKGRSANRTKQLVGATVTKTKTHKKQSGTKTDSGKEQTFFSASDGSRQKKSLANVYKILSANRCSNYYEFNMANPMFNATGGMVQIGGGAATSSVAGNLPVHMYDLTACPNVTVGNAVINGSSTVGTSINQYAPYKNQLATHSTTQGDFQFFQDISPTGYYPAQLVGSENLTGNFSSYPMGGDTFVWTQVKLNLYGCKTLPLTYKVAFIKLKKDYLHPDCMWGGGSPAGKADDIAERNAFWQAVTKPLLYNPILPQDNKHWKDVKILKQDVFHIDPKLTTEVDAVPHVKTISYFERWNKEVNFNWSHEATVSLDNTNTLQTSLGENETTVAPHDRVYLLITCESFTNAAWSVNTNGSYDIMVKHRHDRTV